MATNENTDTTDTTETSGPGEATGTAPEETTASEEHTATSPGPVVTPSGGSGGPSFAVLLLGGFLAAAIGYLAAYYGEFGLFGSDDAEDEMAQIVAAQESRLDEIESLLGAPDEAMERLDASDAGLAELRENLGSLVGDIDSLDERIGGVEAGVSGLQSPEGDTASAFDPERFEQLSQTTDSLQSELQGRIDGLSEQIASLEEAAEDDASQDQIAALEQRLDELSQQVAGAETAAEDEARRISAQAAISEIRAAIEVGEPYSDAVGAYREASDGELPDAVTSPAPEGVATLAELQQSYDDAARDALDASLQVTAGDGALDRFGAFLKSQTGARSLDEREGSGPDAILSRAQARLGEGALDAALSELEALPQEGRDAMSDWIDRARTRLDAKNAAAELPTSSNSN